jgi:hypothetical protein
MTFLSSARTLCILWMLSVVAADNDACEAEAAYRLSLVARNAAAGGCGDFLAGAMATRITRDDSTGECSTPGLCSINEHVSNNACVSCPSDWTKYGGDDPNGEDTTCHCRLQGTTGDGRRPGKGDYGYWFGGGHQCGNPTWLECHDYCRQADGTSGAKCYFFAYKASTTKCILWTCRDGFDFTVLEDRQPRCGGHIMTKQDASFTTTVLDCEPPPMG